MKWQVGTGEHKRIFEDANDAYAYRGKLVHINGHHKDIPVRLIVEEEPDANDIVFHQEKE